MALSGKASASWERIFGDVKAEPQVFPIECEGATVNEDGTITWTVPCKYIELRDLPYRVAVEAEMRSLSGQFEVEDGRILSGHYVTPAAPSAGLAALLAEAEQRGAVWHDASPLDDPAPEGAGAPPSGRDAEGRVEGQGAAQDAVDGIGLADVQDTGSDQR